MAADIAWYHSGAWKIACESGFRPFTMSRPLLESVVRARTLALRNVTLQTGVKVEGLIAEGGRVRGGEVSGARTGRLDADLVVDTTGRGSQLPRWLAQVGFEAPQETVIDLGLGYTSAVFRRDPALAQPWKILIVYPKRPDHRRSCLHFPAEGDRWHCRCSTKRKWPPAPAQGVRRRACCCGPTTETSLWGAFYGGGAG